MAATDSPSRHVTVVDVYDLAAGIGNDFEGLIDQFGADCVKTLMPKVISALETLEAFAGRNEQENEEVVQLKSVVKKLEAEKKEKIENREKFEHELETIEENYKSEIKELWEVVEKLQEENKRLSSAVDTNPKEPPSPSATLSEADLKVMLKLKDTVDKQRDQLRRIERDNEERNQEIEALQQQIEKINRVNKELLRKNRAVQGQGRSLVEEKAELIAQLQARERVVDDLTCQLGMAERARKDLEQTKAALVDVANKATNAMAAASNARQQMRRAEEVAEQDRDNVPRFTLAELREVLQEKNTLKARVMELEEELEALRAQLPRPPTPKIDDDDLPVEGPMPREPDEKLHPWKMRKESGIKRLLVLCLLSECCIYIVGFLWCGFIFFVCGGVVFF